MLENKNANYNRRKQRKKSKPPPHLVKCIILDNANTIGVSFLLGMGTTLCALVVYPCYFPGSNSIIKTVQSSSICVMYEYNGLIP